MSEREFESYLSAITKLLRLKPTQRDAIATELRDHLESRLEELTAKGVDRDTAIQRALDEFGDAAALGHDLTAPHRHQFRRRMMQTSLTAAAVAAVVVLGVTALLPPRNPASVPVVVAESKPAERQPSEGKPAEDGGFAYVTGLVKRSGTFRLPPEPAALSLPNLLAAAGGFDIENADDVLVKVAWPAVGDQAPYQEQEVLSAVLKLRKLGDKPVRNNTLVTLEHAPWAGKVQPRHRAVIDLMPLLMEATGESREQLASSTTVYGVEQAFVKQLLNVISGMGFDDAEFGTLDSWMGLLTVVGSERVIQTAREYVEETRAALRDRREAEAAEEGDGEVADEVAASIAP